MTICPARRPSVRWSIAPKQLLRLQRLVIGDPRFLALGLRRGGGFVGEHDRLSGTPLPDHISARAEDLESLMHGLLLFDRQVSADPDAVIAAAVLAFGFVYIHPFEDGNGRLHRYLIHHVLTRREIIDIPERLLNLLFRFLRQNDGRLSRRALDKEFAALT